MAPADATAPARPDAIDPVSGVQTLYLVSGRISTINIHCNTFAALLSSDDKLG